MDLFEQLYNFLWVSLYIIILISVLGGFLFLISLLKKKKHEKDFEYNLTFLHVKLPKDNEIEIKVAETMFASLHGFKKTFWKSLFSEPYRISFEIVAKKDRIGFYVVVPDEIAALIERQINGAYPSAEIDIINPHEVWDRGKFTQVTELKLKGASYYPIKEYEEMKNDSLGTITSVMSKLKEDEVLALQYVIQPAPDKWRLAGRGFIGKVKARNANPEKKTNVDTGFLEGVEKKISHAGYYTKVRVVSIAENKTVAQAHIQNMVSAFEQFTEVTYNKFVVVPQLMRPKIKTANDFIYRRIRVIDWQIPVMAIPIYSNASVLNTVELATVFHFPNKDVETPNIVWLGARRSSAPIKLPKEGIYIGKSVFRGVEREIRIADEDRTRHFYIIGQTGTGKSQLMMWLALQDIQRGEGVAIIDPHGTDVQELLEKIPPHRKDDVILFDAADTERPLGINLLEAKNEEEKHMIINSFIALLYKLYDPNRQGMMGPQFERAARNVMLTAMSDPESTMIDVLRLLIDEKYSEKFMDKITDPLVKRYWTDEVANTSKSRKGETMGYFVSKFDRFITDRTMRHIIGQTKSSFDFSTVMAERKILLVDLAKGKIGEENSNFLGLLLVPRILAAALDRHKYIVQGKTDFPHFFLYVDEFQNFATPDFETILSEARKYKLNLTVAHQFIAQLDDGIKEAIFGNVGTMCAFRVGVDDAEFLEEQFSPKFTKQDLGNLPVGRAYMRLLVDGHPSPPFSLTVDWDAITSQEKSVKMSKEIKEASRMKYGIPVEEVEKQINERAGYNEQGEPPIPEMLKKKSPRIPF